MKMDKFDKQSRTEKLLLAELYNLGLRPEPQYRISEMTVDFAFPHVDLVIEVNGPHHNTEKFRIIDKKRWFVLNSLGWKRRTYDAKSVFANPRKFALLIKKEINKLEGKEHKPRGPYTKKHKNTRNVWGKSDTKALICFILVLISIAWIIYQNIKLPN